MLAALKNLFTGRSTRDDSMEIAKRIAVEAERSFSPLTASGFDYAALPASRESRFFIGFVLGYCQGMAQHQRADDIRSVAISAALCFFETLFGRDKARRCIDLALDWINACDKELIAATQRGGLFAQKALGDEEEATRFLLRELTASAAA